MRWIALLALSFSGFSALAQSGIIPFTGLCYVENGVHCEEIDVTLEGSVWTGNHLPINTTLVIELEKPTGFTSVDGTYYPDIEVLLTRPSGDTLAYAPGMYGEGFGFSEASLSELSLDLGFNESMKTGDTCNVKARFFDTKGEHSMTCNLQVILVDEKLPLETTDMSYRFTSTDGYEVRATGAEISDCEVTITEHRTLPYLIDINLIDGISKEEWDAGTKTVTVYDEKFHPLNQETSGFLYVIPDPLHTNKGFIEYKTSGIGYTRLRWESSDGKKVVDAIITPRKDKE